MILYMRMLAAKHRSKQADRHLAYFLTFNAGAANAGGFMAVKQYTSHMTGIVSAMADNTVLGDASLVLAGLGAFVAFVSGAACSAILVNWGRRMNLHGEYALPLLLEAVLLACFGLFGGYLQQQTWLVVPATVILLCFVMGLQNAIITKLSQSRIRTTHMTGLVTDMGIEIGKLFYWNIAYSTAGRPPVKADREKLALLASLVCLFFSGGVIGAVAFRSLGFSAALYLALLVLLLAIVPVFDDLKGILRRYRT